MKITKIEIADFCESETIEDSTVTVNIDNSEQLHIQLTSCKHKTSAGCLMYFNDVEFTDLNDDEQERYENIRLLAIESAENFIKEKLEQEFTIYALGFNVAINNNNFNLRVRENGESELIRESMLINDFEKDIEILKTWSNEESAWDEINQHKTGEHNDFRGLNSLLNSIELTK